jgi:hypothetical protein
MGSVLPSSSELPLSPWLTRKDLGEAPPTLLSAALSAIPSAVSSHTPPEPVTFVSSGVADAPGLVSTVPAGVGETTLRQPGLGEGGEFNASASPAAFDRPPPPNPATGLNATLNDSTATPDGPPARVVQMEARATLRTFGRAGPSVDDTAKKPNRRRTPRTEVGKSVVKNAAEIEVLGASFIALLDSKIYELREKRPNSDEGRATVELEIADYEDLKCRVEAFLGIASQFVAKRIKKKSVVDTTNSLAAGLGDWWKKRHVQFCDIAADVGLFGVGVAICMIGGASGAWAVGIPGALVGGRPVVDVTKALAKGLNKKPE